MSGEMTTPERLFAGDSPTVLERTLIAEYLLGKGYLMSELKKLPPQVTARLMIEAQRFTALWLAEIESGVEFPWVVRLPISLN